MSNNTSHSEATKAKIAEAMRKAHAEGRAGKGGWFRSGPDGRRRKHPENCQCPFHNASNRPDDWRDKLSATTKITNALPHRRARSRKAALDRLAWEQREADKLTQQGFEVFVPSWVCDRIAVKDGRVYFVEFKQHGQALRKHQQRLQDVAPGQFMVVFSDYKP